MQYKAYFGNQSFIILTVCCYAKHVGSDDLQNDSIMVFIESSDHNQLAPMICLQKILDKIEGQYERVYNNIFVWKDGMGAQFRPHFVFRILAGTIMLQRPLSPFYNERHHGKGLMDGVGGTVKNVIF